MNNIECANLAAYRIGHGAQHRITSLDPPDGTEVAEILSEIFPHTLEVMLMQYAWPFARASLPLTLAPGVIAPTGFGYAYALPANALRVHFVEYEGFNPDWLSLNDYRGQFGIYANPVNDGQIIVSQSPGAWIWFTKAITDVAYTSPLFADALAWKLAGELGLALKADAKLMDVASSLYTTAESIAIANAANQSGGMVRLSAEAVRVRGAGGYDPAPWLPGHGWPLA